MSNATTWLPAFLTVVILVLYESTLLLVQQRSPARLARLAHADLREQWLAALSDYPGSEVLAVQTLRNSLMAARYYNHAGFICSMPVNSQARQRWAPMGSVYLRRAGLLYSWGLRNLLMVAPILAFIVYPWAGPAAAVIAVAALVVFDSFSMR